TKQIRTVATTDLPWTKGWHAGGRVGERLVTMNGTRTAPPGEHRDTTSAATRDVDAPLDRHLTATTSGETAAGGEESAPRDAARWRRYPWQWWMSMPGHLLGQIVNRAGSIPARLRTRLSEER